MKPNVNYGPCVMMMCQCSFINWKKCATLVGDVDSGGSYAWKGGQGEYEQSLYLLLIIAVNLKPL